MRVAKLLATKPAQVSTSSCALVVPPWLRPAVPALLVPAPLEPALGALPPLLLPALVAPACPALDAGSSALLQPTRVMAKAAPQSARFRMMGSVSQAYKSGS